jgi:hypothetical protein
LAAERTGIWNVMGHPGGLGRNVAKRLLTHGRVYVAAVTMLFATLVTVLTLQIAALVDLVAPNGIEQVICSPGSLHTMVEPPETQLTRDFAAVRVLLEDTGDHFAQVRRIYEGALHVPKSGRPRIWLAKRSERAAVFKADYQRQPWSGSLQQEAHRIDTEGGSALAARIEAGLAAAERDAVGAAFRELFAILLEELLDSIQERLGESVAVGRAFQHVRRYYSVGLEGYLTVQAPAASRSAGTALDAMGRALDGLRTAAPLAREWFERERRMFVRTVHEALGSQAKSL